MRKVVATIAVVCGVGLLVVPFALSLFDRAPAGERVTNRFRETMSVQGLHDLAANFGTMGALVNQFVGQTSPQLGSELHMSPAGWNAYVGRRFPAVAAGVQGIPPLVAFVTPVAAQLEGLHPQFAAVDSLPFLGLSMSTIPWILLALGAGLITLGAVNMVTQVKTQMVPQLAQRLHITTAQLDQAIASRYPAVAKGLAAWPTIKPGAVELVRRQVASVGDAAKMNGLDFTPLPWYIIGPGIALLLSAIATLVTRPQTRWRAAGLRTTGAQPS